MHFSIKMEGLAKKKRSSKERRILIFLSRAYKKFNSIQDGWQKAPPPYLFFAATSPKEGISPKNFLYSRFNPTPLPHCCKIPRILQYQSQIIEQEPRPSLKNIGFSGQTLIKLKL